MDDGRRMQRAQIVAAMVGACLMNEEPPVIASVLAEVMAKFLFCHQRPDDPMGEYTMREDILAEWCDVVRKMVAADESEGVRMQ